MPESIVGSGASWLDHIPSYQLETLARSSLVAWTDGDPHQASQAVHRYQDVLVRHLQQQLTRELALPGPASYAGLFLARDLLEQTRRMVLATVLREPSARPEAEKVVELCNLSRGRSTRLQRG